ncbi:hypothetical protein IV64_GL002501 [Lactiplantibacillus xiangfangensis]|uniref:Uncharacterized protein n=1 Tax=Lactiplantibacillus xiangfangensis TaxID=942150 RepID=A0A0R2MAH5_9LACO|nr:hypothetical protein IV64_GL002501 [Lactiplantibacillus xiangfangensis]
MPLPTLEVTHSALPQAFKAKLKINAMIRVGNVLRVGPFTGKKIPPKIMIR